MNTNPGQAGGTPTAARIGRWIVPAIPFGWTWIPNFGIRKEAPGVIPTNICLGEDTLLTGNQLALYIQAQVTMVKRSFQDPTVAGPAPLAFPGATEAALLMLKHKPMDGVAVFQVQHYIRINRWIGIATLSTIEADLLKVRPDFDQFMKLIRIEPEAG